jgi:hypothetical protein
MPLKMIMEEVNAQLDKLLMKYIIFVEVSSYYICQHLFAMSYNTYHHEWSLKSLTFSANIRSLYDISTGTTNIAITGVNICHVET